MTFLEEQWSISRKHLSHIRLIHILNCWISHLSQFGMIYEWVIPKICQLVVKFYVLLQSSNLISDSIGFLKSLNYRKKLKQKNSMLILMSLVWENWPHLDYFQLRKHLSSLTSKEYYLQNSHKQLQMFKLNQNAQVNHQIYLPRLVFAHIFLQKSCIAQS